jgi:CDP-glucose 4,6-dehydratase
MTSSFWRGRKVLVTGHTGFKGSWLSALLQQLQAEVSGYALAPATSPNLFEAAAVGRGMESVIGNVLDLEHLVEAAQRVQPEIVLHLAAQSLVRASYDDPVGTYAVNVLGTAHVLEMARRISSVRVVIVVTSDKCYENREWVWSYRENERMGGRDPYSSSKGCAELVTAAFRASYFSSDRGPRVASARAGNVIGGGDWSQDRLVPDLMRAFSEGRPAMIRNPAAIRPWQHVLDPLAGYLKLAELLWDDPSLADGWNFGPGDDGTQTVEWVARRLADAWGETASWRLDPNAHPHEAHMLRLDCSKARTRLGWSGRIGLEQAVDATAQWYREFGRAPGAAAELLRHDINSYDEMKQCVVR